MENHTITLVPVYVRIETETGACLRRVKVTAGSFTDVRDIAQAVREELERVQNLEPRARGHRIAMIA